MKKRAWGGATDLVLALLREHRRLTEAQLVKLTGQSQNQVAATIRRLRHDGDLIPKRIYRCAWVSGHAEHKRPHLSPVWALGSLPCAPRPPAISPSAPRPERRKLRENRHLYATSIVAVPRIENEWHS